MIILRGRLKLQKNILEEKKWSFCFNFILLFARLRLGLGGDDD